MKSVLPYGVLALLLTGCAAPVTNSDLQLWKSAKECRQAGPGRVIYGGDSGRDLAACLDTTGTPNIRELRITSPGGDAWETLQVMERFAGKIDLVVVDRLCASSCANYVIPAAKRLIVRRNSFVLLHGSIEPQAALSQMDSEREKQKRQHPEIPAALLDEAIDRAFAQLKIQASVQGDFEQRKLSCPEWLHPNVYLSLRKDAEGGPLESPAAVKWLLVTKTMATRCLGETQVERFWSLPAHGKLPEALTEVGALNVP